MLPPPDPDSVFLNIPYDEEFHDLYVAYIVGLSCLGLVPHVASERPGGKRRLDRILEIIQSCRYSIHDLSRVEVSTAYPATPRFNMPLELGMTIAWEHLKPETHTWFVFESERFRLQKSASDLNGTDPNIHDGTAEGILRELCNAFVRDSAPSVREMLDVYGTVHDFLRFSLEKYRTRSPFDRSVFEELRYFSTNLAVASGVRHKP